MAHNINIAIPEENIPALLALSDYVRHHATDEASLLDFVSYGGTGVSLEEIEEAIEAVVLAAEHARNGFSHVGYWQRQEAKKQHERTVRRQRRVNHD